MNRIELNTPLDMHLHIRDGEMMQNVLPFSSSVFSGALIMPNLQPPITSKELLLNYKERIEKAQKFNNFKPYLSLFFKKDYDFNFLQELKDDILVVKLYPSGVTTNSDDGVVSVNLDEVGETLSAMEKLGILLSVHGETNGITFEREAEFIPTYKLLAKNFPKLKIIMEHISDRRTVSLLDEFPNLFATVTLHHLIFTLDDLLGGSLKPHLFCKPIIKKLEDREALRNLVFSGHKKVMFGSDSAPHLKIKKESGNGFAGIFTAPVLLPALVELFEKFNALDKLQDFISDNAKRIYNINPPQKTIYLEKKSFQVQSEYFGIVPIFAGEKLIWKISE